MNTNERMTGVKIIQSQSASWRKLKLKSQNANVKSTWQMLKLLKLKVVFSFEL